MILAVVRSVRQSFAARSPTPSPHLRLVPALPRTVEPSRPAPSALLYWTVDELAAAAAPFLAAGLAAGERCIHVADVTPLEAVRGALESAGVDVERALAEGMLVLESAQELWLRGRR